jgi:hypothetical protein
MPTGPKGEKRPADVIGNAVKVMRIATGEEEEETKVRSGRVRSGRAGARFDRTNCQATNVVLSLRKRRRPDGKTIRTY